MGHKSTPGDGSHNRGMKGCSRNILLNDLAEKAYLDASGKVIESSATESGFLNEVRTAVNAFQSVRRSMTDHATTA